MVDVSPFVTTDLGQWGTGSGTPQTAAQIDQKFWNIKQAIESISLTPGVGIASITEPAPNQILFTLTDASTYGPFTIDANAPPSRTAVTGTTRTLAITDNWTFLDCTNASGCAITVPPNADVAFDVAASHIGIRHGAAGAVTFVAGTGVTLTVPDGMSLSTAKKGDVAWLVKTATNTWSLYGNLKRATQALATSGTISLDPTLGDATITPAGDATINAASVIVGEWQILVTTSGATSRDITFGTNFRSQGVLSTGTVTAKQFLVRFIGDGTTYREISRTSAM